MTVTSNKEFAKQIGVKFPLLSDMTRKVSKDYGILNDEKQFANRTTFVVDKGGRTAREFYFRPCLDSIEDFIGWGPRHFSL